MIGDPNAAPAADHAPAAGAAHSAGVDLVGTHPDKSEPADDLHVLFPDRDVEVVDPDAAPARVTLSIREYRFREGLDAQVIARPFVEDLADVAGEEKEIGTDAIVDLLAEHAELYLQLIAMAAKVDGKPVDPAWLGRLRAADGEVVSAAMWECNGAFFTQRVVSLLAARNRQGSGSSSAAPSTPSSGPDTAADTTT